MDLRRALAPGWRAWRAYAASVAAFQSAILLSLSYLALVGPVWLLSRAVRRSFLPYRSASSTWVTRASRAIDPRRLY